MRVSRSVTGAAVRISAAGLLAALGVVAAAATSSAADTRPTAPAAATTVDDRAKSGRESDTMQVAYTTGFQVNNTTTTYVLSLNRITGDGGVDSTPPVAAWDRPGEYHRYELTSYLFKTVTNQAVYDVLKLDADGNGTRVGDLKVTMKESRIYNRTNVMTGSTNVPGLRVTASGYADDGVQPYLTVSDSAAGMVTLGPDQPEAQGTVVALIGRPLVTSTYTPKKQVSTMGNPYLVGSPVTNSSGKVQGSTTIGGSTTHGVDSSFTVGTEVTVEYGPIAGTISAAWGKTVSTSTTVSQEIAADIPAHTTVWLEATSDVTRVTGDFTVTIGATTYLLKDTTLDFPQNGGKTAYTLRSEDAAGHVATLRTF